MPRSCGLAHLSTYGRGYCLRVLLSTVGTAGGLGVELAGQWAAIEPGSYPKERTITVCLF